MSDLEENNILIAEFMGYIKEEDGHPYYNLAIWKNDAISVGHYITSQEMGYSASWDWLMPVIEKIFLLRDVHEVKLNPGQLVIGACMIKDNYTHHFHYNDFKATQTWIDVSHEGVVKFIKWQKDKK